MRILLAASDVPSEPALVQAAEAAGVRVVRRCLDAVDLAAAAAVERDLPIVVSMRFPRLGGDVIAALAGRPLVALTRSAEEVQRAGQWGIVDIVSVDAPPDQVIGLIRERLAGGVWTVPTATAPEGSVIAVVSAAGAPGRTTTAIALARYGRQHTCLIDADHAAPAVAFRLGVVDDLSGLALAVRHAHHATLTPTTLRSSCARIDDRLALLSGCGEASEHQVAEVIGVAAAAYDRVILDTAPHGEKSGDDKSWCPSITAYVVVMSIDDLSVARTARWLITEPRPNAVIAVSGIRRRRALRAIRDLMQREGINHPVVSARDLKALDVLTTRRTVLSEMSAPYVSR